MSYRKFCVQITVKVIGALINDNKSLIFHMAIMHIYGEQFGVKWKQVQQTQRRNDTAQKSFVFCFSLNAK